MTKRKPPPRKISPTRIRDLRIARGHTQESLGALVKYDKGTVSHWESGDYAPRSHVLPDLAAALGVAIDDLYEAA